MASNIHAFLTNFLIGLYNYPVFLLQELNLTVSEKQQNLRRLQAQRNELNAKVRMLREELQLLVRPSQVRKAILLI